MKVSYQGTPGAYSEAAVVEVFGEDCERLPCASFHEAFTALQDGVVDRATLPIENSLAGSIHANYDLLLRHEHLHIVGEIDFRVRHCLMVQQSVDWKDIKRVMSHPMALAQVERYLKSKELQPEVAFDTAGSAELLVKDNLLDAAAVASESAAKLHGLKILDKGIEDDSENYTRFIVLSTEKGPPVSGANACKTSIVFTLDDGPGALFKALAIFSILDIDLTKIESRHITSIRQQSLLPRAKDSRRWSYVFYVDCVGHCEDKNVSQALETLKQIT